MATILLLSTADTELLAARNAGAGYRTANPVKIEVSGLAALTADADLAVVRLLSGRKAWPEGLDGLRRAELPLVALGGEAAPDAELMALSTVPAGIAAQALGYLRDGGPENLRELAANNLEVGLDLGFGAAGVHDQVPGCLGLGTATVGKSVSGSAWAAPTSGAGKPAYSIASTARSPAMPCSAGGSSPSERHLCPDSAASHRPRCTHPGRRPGRPNSTRMGHRSHT